MRAELNGEECEAGQMEIPNGDNLPRDASERKINENQRKMLFARAKKLGFSSNEYKVLCFELLGKDNAKEFTVKDKDILVDEFDIREKMGAIEGKE